MPVLIVAWWLVASALQMVNSYLVTSPASILHTTVVLVQKGILIKLLTTSLYRIFAGFGLTFLLLSARCSAGNQPMTDVLL